MENFDEMRYILATKIFKDSVSERELKKFRYGLHCERNNIIEDLFCRLYDTKCLAYDYPREINNPLAYYTVYDDIYSLSEEVTENLCDVFKETKGKLEKMDGEQRERFNCWEGALRHLQKRLEVLKLLFDKYCETDWRGVIKR